MHRQGEHTNDFSTLIRFKLRFNRRVVGEFAQVQGERVDVVSRRPPTTDINVDKTPGHGTAEQASSSTHRRDPERRTQCERRARRVGRWRR